MSRPVEGCFVHHFGDVNKMVPREQKSLHTLPVVGSGGRFARLSQMRPSPARDILANHFADGWKMVECNSFSSLAPRESDDFTMEIA